MKNKSPKTSSVKFKVAIIMGSQSDMKVMSAAIETLKDFKIPYDVKIVSAHRTPVEMVEFAQEAYTKYSVIIAGAGGAAHLPGMVASLTTLPVIGVPVQVGSLKGLDALLSVAQMPKGVPVATMAVDNSANAALLACRILATSSAALQKKMVAFQKKQRQKVRLQNKVLKRGK